MLNIIFAIALIWGGLRLLIFGFRATLEIAKIICTVLLIPLVILGLMYIGLVYLAVPILVITGIALIIGGLAKAVWRTHFT